MTVNIKVLQWKVLVPLFISVRSLLRRTDKRIEDPDQETVKEAEETLELKVIKYSIAQEDIPFAAIHL